MSAAALYQSARAAMRSIRSAQRVTGMGVFTRMHGQERTVAEAALARLTHSSNSYGSLAVLAAAAAVLSADALTEHSESGDSFHVTNGAYACVPVAQPSKSVVGAAAPRASKAVAEGGGGERPDPRATRPLTFARVRSHASVSLHIIRRIFGVPVPSVRSAAVITDASRSGRTAHARTDGDADADAVPIGYDPAAMTLGAAGAPASAEDILPTAVLKAASGTDATAYEVILTLPMLSRASSAVNASRVPASLSAQRTLAFMHELMRENAETGAYDILRVLAMLCSLPGHEEHVRAACASLSRTHTGKRARTPAGAEDIAAALQVPAWLLDVPRLSPGQVLRIHLPHVTVLLDVHPSLHVMRLRWQPVLATAPAAAAADEPAAGLNLTDMHALCTLFADTCLMRLASRALGDDMASLFISDSVTGLKDDDAAMQIMGLSELVWHVLDDMQKCRMVATEFEDTWTSQLESSLPRALRKRLPWPSLEALRSEVLGRCMTAGIASDAPSAGQPSRALTRSAAMNSVSDGQAVDAGSNAAVASKDPVKVLEGLGVRVYSRESHAKENIDWACLAGYDEIKREVEDNVLFPLRHPELYAAVTAQTRVRQEPNQFGSFIFTGPPGTGKTTTARIIAALADRPLVCLNFESIGSQFYSKSENNLKAVLDAVAGIEGAILFIDEAESFFPSRFTRDAHGSSTSSVNNKLLALMLKFLEGMNGGAGNTVILASNRAEELDPALLSRCAGSVTFELPTASQRRAIWKRYAKHLEDDALQQLVDASAGMAGRDVKRIAEVAERRHLADLQRRGVEEAQSVSPPPLAVYASAVEDRLDGVLSMGPASAWPGRRSQPRRRPLDAWKARRDREGEQGEEQETEHDVPAPAAGRRHPRHAEV